MDKTELKQCIMKDGKIFFLLTKYGIDLDNDITLKIEYSAEKNLITMTYYDTNSGGISYWGLSQGTNIFTFGKDYKKVKWSQMLLKGN